MLYMTLILTHVIALEIWQKLPLEKEEAHISELTFWDTSSFSQVIEIQHTKFHPLAVWYCGLG